MESASEIATAAAVELSFDDDNNTKTTSSPVTIDEATPSCSSRGNNATANGCAGSNDALLRASSRPTTTLPTTTTTTIPDNDDRYTNDSATLAANSKSTTTSTTTQAQPVKSFDSSRSSTEILRIAASISSSSSSRPNNEVITLTTDFDNNDISNQPSLDSGSRSLTIRVINSATDQPRDTPPPTFFYNSSRQNFNRRGRQRSALGRLFLACCCGVERPVGEPPSSVYDRPANHSAPPSYSTVVQPPRQDASSRVVPPYTTSSVIRPVILFRDNNSNHNQSSFVVHTPPPSYAQAQGICVAYSLERLVASSGSNGQLWSARSTTAVCPRCATLVFTFVESRTSSLAHSAALALCLMGCWPCCLLPYCIDSCKKAHHYCPFCRTYLGTYMP